MTHGCATRFDSGAAPIPPGVGGHDNQSRTLWRLDCAWTTSSAGRLAGRSRILGLLLVSVTRAGCAKFAQHQEAAQAAQAALDQAQTVLQLTQFVGTAPGNCVPLTPTSQVCTWQVTNRMPGYQTLAQIADTRRIGVSDLHPPYGNEPREPGFVRSKRSRGDRADCGRPELATVPSAGSID